MTTYDMSVDLCGIRLKNPVMTASGTFGSGIEFSEFLDLNRLGAVVTKGVSSVPWEGNSTPRICETPSGMLNAIGLQNPGFDVFAKRDLKFLEETLTAEPETIRNLADYLDAVFSDECLCVIGTKDKIEAAKDLFYEVSQLV